MSTATGASSSYASGCGCIFGLSPSQADIAAAREGLSLCLQWLSSGNYELVVLDEINVAVSSGLLNVWGAAEALLSRYSGTEVVLTGRDAPQELTELADLVTEMREVNHYYRQAVLSRPGIDH